MMVEMIKENRQEMVYVSRAVDRCEATFCSDLGKLRSEVRKEMAKEKNNRLVAMSSLSKLWKLLAAKGVCLDDAIGAVESVCDCGVGSRDGTELAATDDATMPFSSSMMWDDVKVDDVGEGVVLGDAFAVFGDCGVEFDVIGEGRLADGLQERDGMGDLAALSGCAVRDVVVESTGDEGSVGEAVPCESGVDVDRSSVDGPGGGGMCEQDVGASLAFGISYGAVQEPAGEGNCLGGTDGCGSDVAMRDRFSLIMKHESDDEESDDEADDCWDVGVDVYGLDQEQHRFMGWEELCAQERSVFAGAVVVGSGADVVDRQIVARGDVSADGGEIGPAAADVRDDRARIEGLGSDGTDGAVSGIRGSELQAELRADVGGPDVDLSADGGEIGVFTKGVRANRDGVVCVELGGADDAASGIQGPELQTGFRADVDELAIWAAVADGEAIAKQEAATTVLKTTTASGNGEYGRYGPATVTDTAGARRLRAAPGLRDRRELGGKTAPVGEGGGDGWRRYFLCGGGRQATTD